MPEDVQKPESRYRAYSKAFAVVRPADIYRARKHAGNGSPGRLWSVLEHYRTYDVEVRGAMTSVRSPITQQPVEFQLDDDSDEAQQQRDVTREMMKRLGVKNLIKDLIEGHYYGVRAHHLEWGAMDMDGSSYQAPIEHHRIPQSWLYAKAPTREDPSQLYVGNQALGEYEDGSVLTYVDGELSKYEDVDFTMMGAGIAAARFCVFSWYDWEDWAAYNEAWATPSVIGTLLQGWNDDDKELLTQAVNNLGNDTRAVKTDKGELELVWPSGSGNAVSYQSLLQAAMKAIALTIKSEALTDVDISEGGSYAAARTTDGIRKDVAADITDTVVGLINTNVVRPFCRMNWSRCLIDARIEVEVVEDLVSQVRVDKELNAMGLELSRSELYDRYNRRPPQNEEDTLSPQTTIDPLAP